MERTAPEPPPFDKALIVPETTSRVIASSVATAGQISCIHAVGTLSWTGP